MLVQLPAKSNDHMTRASFCDRRWMKNRKRCQRKNTTELNISNIFKKWSSVRVITFLRQVFKCFWSCTSSKNVNGCAHLCKCLAVWCGAEENNRDGFILWWTEFVADILKTFRASPSVRLEFQPYWDKHSVQVFSLTSSLSRTVIVVHIFRCFAMWCRGKETNIAARTDFIYELVQLKSLQMLRNKNAGILKALLEKFLPDRFRKPRVRTGRICKPSWFFFFKVTGCYCCCFFVV